jgi:hypothetical protein
MKGQGILEVVVAISVIIMGLVSIISLVIFNINTQGYSHNMLIASNLAREGVEVIRNIRDSNWLDTTKEWDDGLIADSPPPLSEEKGFLFLNLYFWNSPAEHYIYDLGCSWKVCVLEEESIWGPGISRFSLIEEDNNVLYDQFGYFREFSNPESTEETRFYRIIFINEICLEDGKEKILSVYKEHCEDYAYERIGLQVLSKVGWENNGVMRNVEIEERLYNWK